MIKEEIHIFNNKIHNNKCTLEIYMDDLKRQINIILH